MNFKVAYQYLVEYVLENYGECCEDFELNCQICQQYLALSILEYNIDLEKEDINNANIRRKES